MPGSLLQNHGIVAFLSARFSAIKVDSENGFVSKSLEIINNLAALKWVCLGLFQSYVIDSIQ